MPIRYRCHACEQLLSIATRMVGQVVICPTCSEPTIVPAQDDTGPPAFVPPTVSAPDPPVPSTATGGFQQELRTAPPVLAGEPESDLPLPMAGGARTDPPVVESPIVEQPVVEQRKPDVPKAPATPPQFASPAPAEVDTGGFVVRGRHTDTEEMDLTPMVDMTFLLLIFFMITASFSIQKAIEVPAPSAEQKGAAQTLQSLDELENNSINVRVDERNLIFVEDERVADRTQLTETLRRAMRSTQKRELMLNASDAAFHETVVAVIDSANEAGMQKIRMVSQAGEFN